MIEILRDPLWQFIGALVAVVAIIISVIFYFSQKRRKQLSYEVISLNSILSHSEELEGKLKILFEGEQVNQVHLIVIQLTNTGNIPIISKDYEREISIKFLEDSRILSAQISDTFPSNLGATLSYNLENIKLQPVLLNRGDSITIKTLVSQFAKGIVFDGRIVGIQSIEKMKDTSSVSYFLMIFGFCLIVISIILISFVPDNPTETSRNLFAGISLFLLIFGYILFIIGIISSRRSQKIFRALQYYLARELTKFMRRE